MRCARFITVLTLLASWCVAPQSAATWGYAGSFEPDTTQDYQYMWSDADVSPDQSRKQAYFNVILVPHDVSLNPNLAVLETRVLAPGFVAPQALLGVWKDCNADGYVGFTETALLEYRAELLQDWSICPSTSPHNNGAWVREFLWIGPSLNAPTRYDVAPGLIPDESALVWGDEGLPGDPVSGGCFINPSTGTFSSTGGILAYVDCHGEGGIVDQINSADADGSHGLRFDSNETPQCSDTPLNQRIGLFSDDPRCPHRDAGTLERGSGQPFVTVFDCEYGTSIYDHQGEPIAYVPTVSQLVLDPEGSLYDAVGTSEAAARGRCGGSGGDSTVDPMYDTVNPEDSVSASTVKRDTTFYFRILQ